MLSSISMALAPCGCSAQLMYPGSGAEHHFEIEFMGFNKQSSAVGWQEV